MNQIKRNQRISNTISNIKISSYNQKISNISSSILEILWIGIRININHIVNITVVKKGKKYIYPYDYKCLFIESAKNTTTEHW